MKGFSTNTLGEREHEGLRLYALVVGGLRSVSGENHKQKDNIGFESESIKALPDKALAILTRLDKGLRAIMQKSPLMNRLTMFRFTGEYRREAA